MSTQVSREHPDYPKSQTEVVSLDDRIELLKKRIVAYRDSLSDDYLAPAQVWKQFKHDTTRHAVKPKKQATIQHKTARPVSSKSRLELFTEQLRSITRSHSDLQDNSNHDDGRADDSKTDDEIRMEFRHRNPVTSNVNDLNVSLKLKEVWSPIDLQSLSCLLVGGSELQDVLQAWGRLADIQQCRTGRDALHLVRQRQRHLESSGRVQSFMFDMVFVCSRLPDQDFPASAFVQKLRAERYFGFIVMFIPSESDDSNPTARLFQGTGAVLVLQSQISIGFLEEAVDIRPHIEHHRWRLNGESTLRLLPKRWMMLVSRADICRSSQIDAYIPILINGDPICELFNDLFGLIFARNFQSQSLPIQAELVRRIAHLYTGISIKLASSDPQVRNSQHCDHILFQLPFVLSEAIFAAFDWLFFDQCPGAIDGKFRSSIAGDISFLLSGAIYSNLSLEMIQRQLFPISLRKQMLGIYAVDVFRRNPQVLGNEHNIAKYLDQLQCRREQRRHANDDDDERFESLCPAPLHVDWDGNDAAVKLAGDKGIFVYPKQFRYNNGRLSPAVQIKLQKLNPSLSRLMIQHRSWTTTQCLLGGQGTRGHTLSNSLAEFD